MHAAAALLTSMFALATPALDSEIRAVAALPGEPRIVSAAGVRKDETPVLTLENPDAFDPGSTKRRVVVYSSGASDDATAAVVAMVRWFKSAAPQQFRDEWVLSALPAATFDAADTTSMTRWMTFQAPDVLVEVTDRTTPLVGPGDVQRPELGDRRGWRSCGARLDLEIGEAWAIGCARHDPGARLSQEGRACPRTALMLSRAGTPH
jgi:hypothetical protein